MKKLKLTKIMRVIFWICAVLALFNYDVVAAKLFRVAPSVLENRLAEKIMPDKFWLHRVNSVAKQKELAHKYKGLEFDIIYYEKENAFENSHDKTDLQKYNLEKQFQQYASASENNEIWLDFKNLNENNKKESLECLNNLVTEYCIEKSKIWVESKSWQSLKEFKLAGFKTSYYFPYYKFNEMTEDEIKFVKKYTIDVAESGNVDAVSFHGDHYSFITSLELPSHIVFLSWLDGKWWYEVLLRRKYTDIRNDDRVKVILVKDTGLYHR